MKALTLTQPWATLIALGEKRVETRGWSTPHRGPILIHAAKTLAEPVCSEDGLRELVAREPFAEALGRHGVTVAEQLPRGQVVAVAHIVACLPTVELGSRMRALPELADFKVAEHERAFGDYRPGRFAWLLQSVERFGKAIPLRGGQKLFDVVEAEGGGLKRPGDEAT
jgi:hypothetical protein